MGYGFKFYIVAILVFREPEYFSSVHYVFRHVYLYWSLFFYEVKVFPSSGFLVVLFASVWYVQGAGEQIYSLECPGVGNGRQGAFYVYVRQPLAAVECFFFNAVQVLGNVTFLSMEQL